MSNTTGTASRKPMNKVIAVIMAPLLLLGTLVGSFALTQAANAMNGSAAIIYSNTNAYRASIGAQSLQSNSGLTAVAQAWAEQMAINDPTASGAPQHNPNYSGQIPGGWTAASENVGFGDSSFANIAVSEWSRSPGHNTNMINPVYTDIGVGYATSPEGRGFAVQVFASYPTSPTWPGVTDAPTAVNNGNGTMTVSWNAPAFTGNIAINSYKLMVFDDVNGAQVIDTGDTNSYTLNVDRNRNYDFAVQAVNNIGVGEWSADGTIFIPATEPVEPTVTVNPINVNDAIATFAVTDDGGMPVTSWNVEFNGTTQTLGTNSFTMTDLKRATSYSGSVTAVNAVGSSVSTPFSFTTLATIPNSVPSVSISQAGTDARVNVSWATPTDDGGSAILGYNVAIINGDDIQIARVIGNSTSFAVPKGQTYTASVSAMNNIGNAAETLSEPLDVPYNVTSAPRNVVSELVDEQTITTTWTAPADNGGVDATEYQLAFYANGSEEPAFVATTDGTTFSYTADSATGVLSDTTYTIRVLAVNLAGTSNSAVSAEVVVPRTPTIADAVQNVVVSPTTSTVTVGWAEPESNGGTAITGYNVVIFKDGEIARSVTLGADEFNVTISDLARASDYQVYVSAINSKGESEYVLYNFETPAEAPGMPRDLSSKFLPNGKTQLRWKAPIDNGGKDISEYAVIVEGSDGVFMYNVDGNDLAITLEDISFGTVYSATVSALNADSAGDASEAYSFTSFTLADAPSAVTAVGTSTSDVDVEWTAPEVTGDADIVRYLITTYENGDEVGTNNVDASVKDFTVTNLKRATEYSFTVTAITSRAGIESDLAYTETLADAPSQVQALALDVDDDNVISASWYAPADDGGSAITGYDVTITNNTTDISSVETLAADVTDKTFGDLDPKTPYSVSVVAVNNVGSSEAVVKNIRTGAEKPGVVGDIAFGFAGGPANLTTTVEWTAPAYDGGADISEYVVTIEDVEGNLTSKNVVATGFNMSTTFAMERNVNYVVTVSAGNVKGYGEAVTRNVLTPATASSTVRELTAFAGTSSEVSTFEATWKAPQFNGGCPVLYYVVEFSLVGSGESEIRQIPAATRSITVDAVPNQEYALTVEAVNCVGMSEAENAAAFSNLINPGVAEEVTLVKTGKTQMTVAYDAATDLGGADNRSVNAVVALFTADDELVLRQSVNYLEDAVFKNLKRNTSYYATVTLVNPVGSGAAVRSDDVQLPFTSPESVRNLVATSAEDVTNATVNVAWDAPQDLGGADSASYVVAIVNEDGDVVETKTTSDLTAQFTNLAGNVAYEVTVTVENVAGTTVSAPVNVITNVIKASEPTDVVATIQTNSESNTHKANITWNTPVNDGGERSNDYVVTLTYDATGVKVTEEVVGFNEDTRIASFGVQPNTAYTVTVVSVNSAGNSAVATSQFVTDIYAPSSVSQVELDYDNNNTEMNVSWAEPDYFGGEAPSYLVQLFDTNGTEVANVETDNLAATLTGFAPAASHLLVVTSLNSAGTSPNSIFVSTPATISDAVENLQVTDVSSKVSNELNITWDAPEFNGGASIIGYNVELKDSSNATIVSTFVQGNSLAVTSGLNPVTEYIATVVAVNTVGNSPAETASVTTGTLNPGLVENVTFNTNIVDGINVSNFVWDAPTFRGGVDIASYIITFTNIDSQEVTVGEPVENAFSISGLDPVANYSVGVQAVNEAGDIGDVYVTGFSTTSNAPENVAGLTVETSGGTTANISWEATDDDADGADGRLGIKGYLVTLVEENTNQRAMRVQEFVTGTSVSFNELNRGGNYRVSVATVNNDIAALSAGTEFEFAIDAVKPDVPSSVAANSVTNNSATVTWAAPYNGGSAITEYIVTLTPASGEAITKTVNGSTLFAKFGNLAAETSYSVSVTAKNSVGTSDAAEQNNLFKTAVTPVVPVKPANNGGKTPAEVAANKAREDEKKKLSETGSDASSIFTAAGVLVLGAGVLMALGRRKAGKSQLI